MTAAGNYLFISGGISQTGGGVIAAVYRATRNPDGTLGAWVEQNAAPLPRQIWGHEMLAHLGYLYTLTGLETTSISAQYQVYQTPIDSQGDLSGWQELTNNALPQGVYDAAMAHDDLFLLIAGGLRDGQSRSNIYRAALFQGAAFAAYVHEFDLGLDADIGVLEWQSRGDAAAALSLRYRIAPAGTASYGPWSTPQIGSPLPVYDRGRYLQYQVLAENQDNGVGSLDAISLTYGDVGDYIKAVDEYGAGVAGAAVYLNGQFAGTTGDRGIIPPDSLARPLNPGDRLAVLSPVSQTNTVRAAHTTADSQAVDWAYRTYLTNIDISDTGQLLPDIVTQPGGQIIRLRPDRPLVLYNLVVSIEWDATLTYTRQISRAVHHASDYLYDITDGQMAFAQVNIYDNAKHWSDADLQISTKNIVRPHAYIGGVT